MSNSKFANGSLVAFFSLTILLSAPFYILNALAYLNVVGKPEWGAVYITLFTLTPMASASILTFRRGGRHGLKDLLYRVSDFTRITDKRWYLTIFLLSPLIFLLSSMWFVWSGVSVPPALAPLTVLPIVFIFFFLLAAGKEVGWMGYAYERLQTKGSALRASLVLGMVWALWHIPFFVFLMPDPFVLAAQLIMLMGMRILIVWVFNNTGNSVSAAILIHAVDNTALVTFPEIKAVEPWGTVILCGLVMITAIGVTILWGGQSLAQYRFSAERNSGESK